MAAEKLLHVSCIVRESRVWDLLRLLESGKANNVEVRPVASLTLQNGAENPQKKYVRKYKKRGGKRSPGNKLRAALKLNKEVHLHDLALAIKINPKSAMSAMTRLIAEGVAKHTGKGTYMRVKADGAE